LDRRLGGPQSLSGHGGEERISQLLPGLEHPIIQPVVQRYTTELSQFVVVVVIIIILSVSSFTTILSLDSPKCTQINKCL
jgi:hypothetical protein